MKHQRVVTHGYSCSIATDNCVLLTANSGHKDQSMTNKAFVKLLSTKQTVLNVVVIRHQS